MVAMVTQVGKCESVCVLNWLIVGVLGPDNICGHISWSEGMDCLGGCYGYSG